MAEPQPDAVNYKHNVFFSHKIKDQKVTNSIIDLLDRHTEQVKFFISENIEKGVPWRKAIAEQLGRSSCLVLVFTDPAEDWGWCLYETGFFDALSQIPPTVPTRRIYCLHNESTTAPSPIADLQSVPAKVQDVTQWLTELYAYTEQTKQAFLDDIPLIAENICKLFKTETKPIYLADCIKITLKPASLGSPDDLPSDATIDGDEWLIEELFGIGKERINWESAKKQFSKFPNSSDANFISLKEMSRCIYNICNNNRVVPVQGTLFVGQGPKRYRPVIYRAKELSEGSIGCEVLLIEEAGGQLQNVDKSLGALLTSIRIGVRIRWEIVRPFVSNLRWLAKNNAYKLRFDLQTCFNNIFLEAEFRGIYNEQDVLNAFESGSRDKQKISEIMDKWKEIYPEIWRSIGFPNVNETFGDTSDQPFVDTDLTFLENGLVSLEKLNREFLDVAVVRAAALIQGDLRG